MFPGAAPFGANPQAQTQEAAGSAGTGAGGGNEGGGQATGSRRRRQGAGAKAVAKPKPAPGGARGRGRPTKDPRTNVTEFVRQVGAATPQTDKLLGTGWTSHSKNVDRWIKDRPGKNEMAPRF